MAGQNLIRSIAPYQSRWLLVGVALIASLGSVGCSPEADTAASVKPESRTQKVRVAEAQRRDVTEYVELVGRTTANESVEIRARVSGFLQKIHFVDGQLVTAGDLLFTIEPDEYQAILDQANSKIDVAMTRLDLAQKVLARTNKLIDNNAASQEQLEQDQASVAEAKATVQAAKADAKRVQLDVDYTQIKSPITGRVDQALLDEGNFVTGGLGGGTVLTLVVNDQPIKAVASVDENVRLRFMRRQRELAGDDFKAADKLTELKIPCDLALQDETGFPHPGLLEFGETVIDANTGTSQIRGVFNNDDGLLTPGMFVRLRVPMSEPTSEVLVPEISIGTDQATRFVFVVDDQNKIETRTVEMGIRQGSWRVINSGVSEGDAVVVGGLQLIKPGMTVQPIQADESPRIGAE